MSKRKYTDLKTLGILAVAVGFGLASAHAQMQQQREAPAQPQQQQRGGGAGGDIQQQLQQVQMALQETQSQLQPAIQQANEQPEVRDALMAFDRSLTEHMIELEPNRSDEIERRSELFENLVTNRDFGSMEEDAQQEYQQQVQEYQGLQQTLMESERQAIQEPAVRGKLEAYQETQRQALIEVEPRAAELLERQDQLRQQFQSLQRQLQEAAGEQGGRRPMR